MQLILPVDIPVASGPHTITAQDAAGCISPAANVTIAAQPPAITDIQITSANATCGNNNGSVTLGAVTGGTAPFTYSFNGSPFTSTTVYNNLAPGPYTISVRDANGCAFTPSNANIINIPGPTNILFSASDASCGFTNGTVTIGAVTGGTAPFTYSFNGSAYTTTTFYNNLPAGNYTISVKDANGCIYNAPIPATVNGGAGATAIQITPVDPSCGNNNGSITLGAVTGGLAPFTYSFNGSPFNNTTVYNNLAAGTYMIAIQDANGCVFNAPPVVLIQIPAPLAPTTAQVDPTCTIATGTITITSSTAGLTFSLDGGGFAAYPAGGYTVASGAHTITAQNAAGCVSAAANVTIAAQPAAPAAPTTAQVDPTCTVATGTITITSSTAGLTFSLDAAPYAAYPAGGYTTVASGAHTITAQNAAGCISAAANITTAAQPAAPAAPTASVTVQPTCAVPTGTIVVTAPTGAGLQYSIDGTTYQASQTFNLVAPGTYDVTVRNAAGCVSAATSLTVNGAPTAPAAPTASVTVQPTCAVPTGTIVVTAPTGAGLQYSIDGTTYQASQTFNLVAPGTYDVTVRNAAGCVSAATSLTVNGAPTAPAAPTASVTVQPTCAVPTGTIVVTAPTGAGLQLQH